MFKVISYVLCVVAALALFGLCLFGLEKYIEARTNEKANVFIQGYEAQLYQNPYFKQARDLTIKAIQEQEAKAKGTTK